MAFELSRMFTSHTPEDFLDMPLGRYLKYRAYYTQVGEQAAAQRENMGGDPDVNVIDFDKDILKREPV